MRIHRISCPHNYDTTVEVYEVEKIVGVFGGKTVRWFNVKWADYDETEWEREHLHTYGGVVHRRRGPSGAKRRQLPDDECHHRENASPRDLGEVADLRSHRLEAWSHSAHHGQRAVTQARGVHHVQTPAGGGTYSWTPRRRSRGGCWLRGPWTERSDERERE